MIINHIALIGVSTKIKKAPTKQPINAPTNGIKAVNAINTPIINAYGILKIVIATTNKAPNMTASTHCPVRNFEKLRYSIER